MEIVKIIPCLDTRDGRLVKGVNFVDVKDVGDPAEYAKAYCDAGADELVFLDITATIEGRQTRIEAVKRTVQACSIPLTVGGGIRTVDDIKEMLDLGVSRLSMNSAAVKNPKVVEEAAKMFGSDKVTVAIDTRKSESFPSGFEVVVSGGTKGAGIDAVQWAREVEQLGAGAILPTSMDTDGMRTGYDLPMTRAIADAVKLPVIASGGAGSLEDLYDGVVEGHAASLLVASIAHFGTFTIRQMKDYLAGHGIPVRL